MKLMKGPPVKDPRTVIERFKGVPVKDSKKYDQWKAGWKSFWQRRGRWEELKNR